MTGDPRRPLYGFFRRGGVEGPVHRPLQGSRASQDAPFSSGGDPDGGPDRRVPGTQGRRRTGNRSPVERSSGARADHRILGNFVEVATGWSHISGAQTSEIWVKVRLESPVFGFEHLAPLRQRGNDRPVLPMRLDPPARRRFALWERTFGTEGSVGTKQTGRLFRERRVESSNVWKVDHLGIECSEIPLLKSLWDPISGSGV